MGLGDFGDVLGPSVPVFSGAAFLDDLGHDGAGELVKDEDPLRVGFSLRPARAPFLPDARPGLLAPDLTGCKIIDHGGQLFQLGL